MPVKPGSELPGIPVDAGLTQLPQTVTQCHAVIELLIQRVKLPEDRKQWDGGPPHVDGIGVPQWDVSATIRSDGATAMKITTIDLHLAKNVFQVHGVNERGKAVLRKGMKRDQVATVAGAGLNT